MGLCYYSLGSEGDATSGNIRVSNKTCCSVCDDCVYCYVSNKYSALNFCNHCDTDDDTGFDINHVLSRVNDRYITSNVNNTGDIGFPGIIILDIKIAGMVTVKIGFLKTLVRSKL